MNTNVAAMCSNFSNISAVESVNARDGVLFLQPLWNFILANFDFTLKSPLFPPVYALAIDYTWVAIFTFLDVCCRDVEFVKRAKIQKDKVVTWPIIKETLKLQLYNLLVWIYPAALAQLVWMGEVELPRRAPTVWQLCWQLVVFCIIFDATYFAFHLTMHRVRFLYRWCHSVHHAYSSPFAAAASHLHPFELFFVGTVITCMPWLFNTHPLTYWIWFAIAQNFSYEIHTGYDFPFMLHRFVPFVAGTPAHDMHHVRPLTCFEPWFNYLDWIFGTNIPYDKLKRMATERAERYGKYSAQDEAGLKKYN